MNDLNDPARPIDYQDEKKDDIKMLEHAAALTLEGNPKLKDANLGQELTGYEDLTLWQTAKTFKKTCLLCLAVTFSAAAEGYEASRSIFLV